MRNLARPGSSSPLKKTLIRRKMIRKTALFAAFTLLAGWLEAQTIISGSVKDTKGHPVRGASITIKDSYDGATADSTGAFRFKTTETGTRTLTITTIGYNPVEQSITPSGEAIALHIVMKEQLSELKAVTIT